MARSRRLLLALSETGHTVNVFDTTGASLAPVWTISISSNVDPLVAHFIHDGDITTPEKAKFVLDYTGADAVMIGRAAQGRPWIFREIAHFLATGTHLPLILVT